MSGERTARRNQSSPKRRRQLHPRPHAPARARDDCNEPCRKERFTTSPWSRPTASSIPASPASPTPSARPIPTDPAKLIVTTSHPAPYTRRVAVYVPKQYVPGTAAPFIVGADGPDRGLFTALDNLIAAAPRAGDDRHLHRQRQRRRAGQRARPGIRHHVRPLRRVRRDRSAAAGRKAVQRETDQGPRRPRHHGRQFRRLARP